jgi:hypothetical protein
VDNQLSAVHPMLRLPMADVPGFEKADCTYAAAGWLLSIVSGASYVLFDPNREMAVPDRFKESLVEHYPWAEEPTQLNARKAAGLLYDVFRTPLAHAFGLQELTDPRTRIIVKGTFSEDVIEAIERAEDRPERLASTISRSPRNVTVLQVEALYWGVRAMIRRMTADPDRMDLTFALLRRLMSRRRD